ncbi:hypothetical protein BOW51_12220 [Solemya velesiana gill symbiont]|uniref:DUF7793 domain-containing protein n=2 Tax=Solemya velesiana gill symbiont TaxID=1918948 RepID=A0A1T2KNF4_9GAMM|nr:hypothetical protein BOW51_12220 [Solemya velesiana gill symbiont]
METLETGKVRITPEENQYLLFTLYNDGEVTSDDMSDIREYLAQFDGKVSLLVLRESYYSFSSEALLIMTREAGSMINAVAYVDRSPQDKLLSEYAEKTYLRNIPVQSFQSQDEAASWFEQYGPLPSRL